MKTLDELRRDIDAADKDLLDAFARRLNTAKTIGEVKKIAGKPVFDETREAIKLDRLESIASFEARPYVRKLYKEIMDMAKDLESKPLFGVLGRSIPHTYSPQIHDLITTDYAYTVIEREENELGQLWDQGRRGVYGGFNVTIPYKRNACSLCDGLTPCAKNINAVNTVVFKEDGKTLGANTDVYGFIYMLKSSGIDPAGKNVLILGTGGASSAVNEALVKLNAGSITFVSRSGEVNYTNVYDSCKDAQIIVNCTPVGMYPEVLTSPVEVDRFPSLEAVADLVYNPSCTRFLYDAKKLGLKTAGGLKMLVAQAFKASAFFRGANTDEEAEASVSGDDIERVTKILEKRMKNITIIGMPGSGKTELAAKLASHLGREFIDLDIEYTKKFGQSPAQTIKSEGEDAFRKNESQVALEHLIKSGCVISCGGGIVTRDENTFPIRCNSLVVYNERPLDALNISGRPISASKGNDVLYEERKGAYESLSDIKIFVETKETLEEYLEEAVRIYDEDTCS